MKATVEKLRWYALRWKIETFHKVLKSGCRAEEARLRTAERLVKLIAVFCILSWRVFWMTMLNRSTPNANPSLALTRIETAFSIASCQSQRPPATAEKDALQLFDQNRTARRLPRTRQ